MNPGSIFFFEITIFRSNILKPGLTNRGVQIVHDVYVYGSELQRSSGEFGVYVGWANDFFFNLYYSGNWMKGDFVYSYTQPVVSHVKFTWEESHVNFTWSVTWNSHEIKKKIHTKFTWNSCEMNFRWNSREAQLPAYWVA